MKRHLSRLIEVVLLVSFVTLELSLGSMGREWLGTPAYFALVFATLLIGFTILAFWVDTSGKTWIDDLEEIIERGFQEQAIVITNLTQSINEFVEEIRNERRNNECPTKSKQYRYLLLVGKL